jgi:hypothetical protein
MKPGDVLVCPSRVLESEYAGSVSHDLKLLGGDVGYVDEIYPSLTVLVVPRLGERVVVFSKWLVEWEKIS